MAIPPALVKAALKGGKKALEHGIPLLTSTLINRLSKSGSKDGNNGSSNNGYNY